MRLKWLKKHVGTIKLNALMVIFPMILIGYTDYGYSWSVVLESFILSLIFVELINHSNFTNTKQHLVAHDSGKSFSTWYGSLAVLFLYGSFVIKLLVARETALMETLFLWTTTKLILSLDSSAMLISKKCLLLKGGELIFKEAIEAVEWDQDKSQLKLFFYENEEAKVVPLKQKQADSLKEAMDQIWHPYAIETFEIESSSQITLKKILRQTGMFLFIAAVFLWVAWNGAESILALNVINDLESDVFFMLALFTAVPFGLAHYGLEKKSVMILLNDVDESLKLKPSRLFLTLSFLMGMAFVLIVEVETLYQLIGLLLYMIFTIQCLLASKRYVKT